MPRLFLLVAAATFCLSTAPAGARDVESVNSTPEKPSFDLQRASVTRDGSMLVFRIETVGTAGAETPEPVGQLKGAPVYSYVWPTSLDPSAVGFSPKSGILAFAITAHPDFDDTPLFDEDGDGDPANDGRLWHSHWVVLTKTDACGPSGLKVRDIVKGETHDLPKTWPNLPILIDSPGWSPILSRTSVTARVPFEEAVALKGVSFDGVTAALRVNANAHAPLLCVSAVYDVASGDLSLPGLVE